MRAFDREWEVVGQELRCGPARILTGERLGWANPRGAVISLRSERGCRQFDALLRAELDSDEAMSAWLDRLGLAVYYGSGGAMIGQPDPVDPLLPPVVRASGLSLRQAVTDLAARL